MKGEGAREKRGGGSDIHVKLLTIRNKLTSLLATNYVHTPQPSLPPLSITLHQLILPNNAVPHSYANSVSQFVKEVVTDKNVYYDT